MFCHSVCDAFSLSVHFTGFIYFFNSFSVRWGMCSLREQKKRVALLMAAAVFEGASIGPLIDLAIEIDPRCVPFCDMLVSVILFQLLAVENYSVNY